MPLLFDDATNAKVNNLNIVRLLLAIAVIFSHSFPVVFFDNRFELTMLLTRGQDSTGELAVNAFFAISGFLIVQSWLASKTTADYLKKRVLRIYPGFLVATLFSAFVVGPLAAASSTGYFQQVFHQIRGLIFRALTLDYPHLPQVFQYHLINNSLWTIRYEFWCYLLVIAIGAVGLLKRPKGFLGLFAFVFLVNAAQEIYVLKQSLNVDTFYGFTHGREILLIGRLDYWPRFLTYFLTGIIFYLYRSAIPRSLTLLATSLLLITATAISGLGLNILLPLCGTYALFYLCFAPRQWGKAITGKGDFSYGVYLYAFPVQQMLHFWFPGVFNNPYRLFFAATLATLPIAALSWYGVEKPLLRLKRQSVTTARTLPPAL